MHISLSLVGLTLLALQCRSHPVENDRQYPAVATQYQPIDRENLRQERQLQQLSRQDRRIPHDYRYQYDPDQSYPAETQYQLSYSGPSNNIISSRPQQLKQPAVEQYLKEVTPTTKTTYDPSTYQAEGSNQAQTAKEAYFQHPEAQKRPYIQHPQYELSESSKETPVPQNVLAYQNALIAQQNAIYEQQRVDQLQKQQDNAQKSSFYAPQSIQKKPTVGKLVKPKPSSLDEELEYLTRLQYQQQQQQQQNKQPLVAKYQARIPQYSKPELLATVEEQAQTYQPQVQYTLTRFAKPSKAQRLQIYQPENQQDVRYKPLAQPETSSFDQFDHTQYEQPQLIQYQPQPQHQELTQPQQYSAGPKYLPEQKLVRYQQPVEEKYTQQVELPRDEALQKYRAAKYHGTDSGKTEPRPQIRPQYVQHEQPQRFQEQQYEQPAAHQQQQPQQQKPSQEIYQGPTDEEYRQSEFKQSLGLNSSLRVLKSGKPVVFIGHEE